jgi:DNA-directed RNA polymerase-3 subunit RPC5
MADADPQPTSNKAASKKPVPKKPDGKERNANGESNDNGESSDKRESIDNNGNAKTGDGDDDDWVSTDEDATSEEESSEYDSDDSNDPIVTEYDIFINDPDKNDLWLLGFVGRDKSKKLTGPSCPTELRIKHNSGYFEVDMPLDIEKNYDRQKGVRYGEALRKTKNFGQDGYGPAAGFMKAMPKPTKRPGASDDDEHEPDEAAPPVPLIDDDNVDEWVHNFQDANEKGHVLNKITWGGQMVSQESWKPNYMIGAFRGNELHLSPLKGQVMLQPEMHHQDAMDHLEAASRRREITETKDVVPEIKKPADELTLEEKLKGNAAEPWTKYKWIDCESDAALEYREKRLYLEDAKNAPVVEFESPEEYVNRFLPVVVGDGKPGPGPKKKKPGVVS